MKGDIKMRSFPLPSNRQFGEYYIEFFQGSKNSDDYIIKINGKQITDEFIFERLHFYSKDKEKAKQLVKLIWELGQNNIDEEENVYNKIRELKIPDDLKAVLFSAWHRLIIDDINYPVEKGLNGRKRLLGQIYLLLAKKFGFPLPDFILTLPKEIFKLGFPRGISEVISTAQWNEAYIKYRDFYEGRQNA